MLVTAVISFDPAQELDLGVALAMTPVQSLQNPINFKKTLVQNRKRSLCKSSSEYCHQYSFFLGQLQLLSEFLAPKPLKHSDDFSPPWRKTMPTAQPLWTINSARHSKLSICPPLLQYMLERPSKLSTSNTSLWFDSLVAIAY